MNVAPILVFGYGNPSRGDDALGPELLRHIEPIVDQPELAGQVELLTDFQLQIEHALDLQHRELVLFVDASLSATEPFDFYALEADRDVTFTTHEMSPQSVLSVYQKINNAAPPPCFMLAIHGYAFNLGEPLTDQATSNLEDAVSFVASLLGVADALTWHDKIGLHV